MPHLLHRALALQVLYRFLFGVDNGLFPQEIVLPLLHRLHNSV